MNPTPFQIDIRIRIFYHACRLVMAFVFIYASLDKIAHPGLFAQAVYNYQLLPSFLINLTALILPWLELVLGVCLLANRWMEGASSLVAGLMVVFMAAIAFNLARGLDISCGCFSVSTEEGPVSALTLMRDFLFLGLSVCLAVLTFYIRSVRQRAACQ